MDAYWRAANYLSVGQIYLYDNPLLEATAETVAREAAGDRTLGHDAGVDSRRWRAGVLAQPYLRA